jgi:hypothetical protein
MLTEPNQKVSNTTHQNGSQMSERKADDIEFVMARIYAMKEAKKNLEREIREDEKYLREFMEGKEEHETPSYVAVRKSFVRESLKTLDEISLILGEDVVKRLTKKTDVSYVSIKENIEFEPFVVESMDLLPKWAHRAYIELQVKEQVSA